jgi:phage terminase large subunit-like protein
MNSFASDWNRSAAEQELRLLMELESRRARRKIYALYPETGALSRHNYDKHTEFFAAGALHNERAFIGANRSGKSFCVGYEATCHLIGWYPDWWVGRRFDRGITCWASGEDAKAVRESLQPTLIGPADARGTGLIPGDLLGKPAMRGGIPDAIDFVQVGHSSGSQSRLVFKAYEQGRESFQASRVDVVLFDEEPPLSIYTEGLTRTLATVPGEENGLVMCAFTPLKGLSETVLQFLPGGAMPATETLRKQAWNW